jgi:hypothetical protein
MGGSDVGKGGARVVHVPRAETGVML